MNKDKKKIHVRRGSNNQIERRELKNEINPNLGGREEQLETCFKETLTNDRDKE